jgi:hypothetical protein
MSKNQHEDHEEAIGSDSFLDIASNIVGVLIILVLVAATRIPEYVSEAVREAKSPEAKTESKADLSTLRNQARQIDAEVGKLVGEAGRLGNEIQATKYAREQIAVAIALAEHQLKSQREKLSDREQRAHRLGDEFVAAKLRLDQMRREQLSLVSAPEEEVQVVAYPSAISKTVFTREQHYRLLGGKLVRVPMEELQNKLFDDRRQLRWKLEDLPEVTGSVDPIDGFRMDYQIVRTQVGADVEGECVPVQADLGEPIDVALAEGSQFRQALARLDREYTTITLWTYPDSFDEFRRLKKELYVMGFGVAGRPMRRDSRIGFSSISGSKSSAQ